MSINIRIFPKPDPAAAEVVAVLEHLPARLSDLLAIPVTAGKGEFLSAWIVSNGGAETDVFLFRSIEDRTAFVRLAEIARSGLRFVQGFETNRLRFKLAA